MKRSGSYLQGQGHSAGSNPQKITFFIKYISPELVNVLQADWVQWCIIMSWSVNCDNNFGLLSSSSRSRSQCVFKFCGSIYLETIASDYTTEPFVMNYETWYVGDHHDLESHAESLGSYLQGLKVTV